MTEGKDPRTGQFQKGNKLGKGRPKGSRNALTKKMLDRFAERNDSDETSVEYVLFDIMNDPKSSADLKFKAAKQLSEMVFPKAQSVQLEIESEEGLTYEQMDARIAELMGLNKVGDDDDEASSE